MFRVFSPSTFTMGEERPHVTQVNIVRRKVVLDFSDDIQSQERYGLFSKGKENVP